MPRSLVALAAALLLSATAVAQPRYRMVEIKAPAGYTALATALAADGTTAGLLFPSDWNNPAHAFRADRDGRVTDLGTLGGTGVWVGGVNASGQVAASVFPPPPGGQRLVRVDRAGHATDFGEIGVGNGRAAGINAGGRMVGTGFTTALNENRPFRTRADGGIDWLPLLPGGYAGEGRAINDAGTAVGLTLFPDGTARAARYAADGRVTDLGTPAGSYITVGAISGAGHVVGSFGTPDGDNREFIVAPGKTVADAGSVVALDGHYHDLEGVNSAGVAVGMAWDATGSFHALLFDGRAHDLNDLVADTGGLHLREAGAIADDGTILAVGLRGGGEAASVLLMPDAAGGTPPAETPEPATLLLALPAVAAAAWRSRRRAG